MSPRFSGLKVLKDRILTLDHTHSKWHYYFFAVCALGVLCIWLTLDRLGWFADWEYTTLDWRFRARGQLESPGKIIYAELDSEALSVMGERPIPRSFFARAIEAIIEQGKAKVVGVDSVFSGSAQSILVDPKKVAIDNEVFRLVLDKYQNVVLGAAYTGQINPLDGHSGQAAAQDIAEFPYLYQGFRDREKNGLPEQPEVELIGFEKANLGLINVADHYSPGAIARWVPLFAYSAGPTYYTMALEMLRVGLGFKKNEIHIDKDTLSMQREGATEAWLKVPLTEEQLIEVNWFTPWAEGPDLHYSLKTVLAAAAWAKGENPEQQAQAAEFFRTFNNAYVLIGPTDPLLHDLSPTPLDNQDVPRVGVHGNLLKTLLLAGYLERMPFFAQALLVTLLTALLSVSGMWTGRYSILLKLGALSVLVLYVVFSFWTFSFLHWVLPIVSPIGCSVSVGFMAFSYQLIRTEKQKSHMKDLFSTYISPELVENMVEKGIDPHLGGEDLLITAFFSDIEKFSYLAEGLSPKDLMDLMNEYLSAMTRVLQDEKGTLDKYIGDAIVALFGAPIKMENHALAACKVACKIQRAQIALCKKWEAKIQEKAWPKAVSNMRTRIGINTGIATVGNMGSAMRFNYSMLGDMVNLAARLESACKGYGVYTLISQSTYEAVCAEKCSDIVFRLIDRIVVSGKTQPVQVYEVLGFKSELSNFDLECKNYYEAGLAAYFKADWKAAKEAFQLANTCERIQFPEAINPSRRLLARCTQFENNPPSPTWQGAYQLSEK